MLDFLQPQAEQLHVLVPLEHAQLVPHPQAMFAVSNNVNIAVSNGELVGLESR